MSEKLLTIEELAETLNVSVRSVKNWRADGTIPAAIHEGRVVRFDLPSVKRALAKRARRTAPAKSSPNPGMALTY